MFFCNECEAGYVVEEEIGVFLTDVGDTEAVNSPDASGDEVGSVLKAEDAKFVLVYMIVPFNSAFHVMIR